MNNNEKRINPSIITSQKDIQNPQNYVILEGRTHGNYSYPTLAVQMYRRDNCVEAQDMHKEYYRDPKDHLNRTMARSQIQAKLEGILLTPRQFIDFKKLIESGIAYNAKGDKIDKRILDEIYEDTFGTKKRGHRREWLDAYFTRNGKDDNCYVIMRYSKINSDGTIGKTSDTLDVQLRKNCFVDINSADDYGMPTKELTKGTTYWWPKDDSISGFIACPGLTMLDFTISPYKRDFYLGIRLAKILK